MTYRDASRHVATGRDASGQIEAVRDGGRSTRGYLFLFPTLGGGSWGPYLNDRFAFVGTIQSYWDAFSGLSATLYSAALQHNSIATQRTPRPLAIGALRPSRSQYDSGMDKDTLQQKKLLQSKLNYAL